MQSKLLPCPFCGGEAQLKQTGSKQITIRCKSCPAKMVQKVLRYSVEWLEESMMGDWNKRAAEQSVHQTCSTCGGENGKHELDCRVAHNMLAETASR